MVDLPDIYFSSKYGELNEGIENGTSQTFSLNSEHGKIKHHFILREIPFKIGKNNYYDIVTPYGYGGPIILEVKENKKEELIEEFNQKFFRYCKKNNIISEFVRFHPIVNNAESFTSIYDISTIRKTLGTNLEKYEDPFQREFSRSARKNVRRALKDGISYEVIEKPSDIGAFKEIYYSTMDRNSAENFYYFNDSYFDKALELFRENIIIAKAIYKGKTIAQGFYFVYGDYIHLHLSGTLSEYIKLSPAYILRYAATIWGKENGYRIIHHGGGRSNSAEDSLYLFKKRFAQNTEFDFKVGRKVWDEKVYNKLCEVRGVDPNIDFFPAYRS